MCKQHRGRNCRVIVIPVTEVAPAASAALFGSRICGRGQRFAAVQLAAAVGGLVRSNRPAVSRLAAFYAGVLSARRRATHLERHTLESTHARAATELQWRNTWTTDLDYNVQQNSFFMLLPLLLSCLSLPLIFFLTEDDHSFILPAEKGNLTFRETSARAPSAGLI
jgi:hypothetical protein